MQMEYSVDDIATAGNLQFLAYIYTSTATFWTYDFVCSLDEEWTFLLRSRWTKVKGLNITRYVPYVLIILDLCLALTQNENPNKCQMFDNIFTCTRRVHAACTSLPSVALSYHSFRSDITHFL
ncbi:hypothetical protein F4604DRAFT_434796 [Suillus subluteus]|nr:hypothetical protein F4604DRAFT_434796 [Suillus subluteus]